MNQRRRSSVGGRLGAIKIAGGLRITGSRAGASCPVMLSSARPGRAYHERPQGVSKRTRSRVQMGPESCAPPERAAGRRRSQSAAGDAAATAVVARASRATLAATGAALAEHGSTRERSQKRASAGAGTRTAGPARARRSTRWTRTRWRRRPGAWSASWPARAWRARTQHSTLPPLSTRSSRAPTSRR